MNYKYTLPDRFWGDAMKLEEFANGAAQVSVKTNTGDVFSGILISGSRHIVAARGFDDLPFSPDSIDQLYQTTEDKNPSQRGGWNYWDKWK